MGAAIQVSRRARSRPFGNALLSMPSSGAAAIVSFDDPRKGARRIHGDIELLGTLQHSANSTTGPRGFQVGSPSATRSDVTE